MRNADSQFSLAHCEEGGCSDFNEHLAGPESQGGEELPRRMSGMSGRLRDGNRCKSFVFRWLIVITWIALEDRTKPDISGHWGKKH